MSRNRDISRVNCSVQQTPIFVPQMLTVLNYSRLVPTSARVNSDKKENRKTLLSFRVLVIVHLQTLQNMYLQFDACSQHSQPGWDLNL